MEKIQRDKGYDFIRFIAILMIVIYHFYTTCVSSNYKVPELVGRILARGNIRFGNVGVALFFILSGAVLLKTYRDKLDIYSFYKKRMIRIYLPLWIGFLAAFALAYIVNSNISKVLSDNKVGVLAVLLGVNYGAIPWGKWGIQCPGLVGEWFTPVIIFIYILFPIFRWLFLKYHKLGTIIVTVIFAINLKVEFLTGGGGFVSITNGIMCFWLGMLFEKYKEYLQNKVLLIIDILFIILFWYLNPTSILGVNYLPGFVFAIALFIVQYQIKISTPFISYICKYNYEIYLVHHRIFLVFIPVLLTVNSSFVQILLTFILLFGMILAASEKLNQFVNFLLHIKFTKSN